MARLEKDHYRTLNVHPSADADVMKAAYRVLVKKHNGDSDKMVALNAAWEILGDQTKRQEYDDARKAGAKKVGMYSLLEKIGEGGFGETWKVRHNALGTLACLKYAINVTPEDESLLLEEAKSMWELRHYSIPAIRDLVKMDDGKIALVMSYVPGPTLAQLVENNYPNGMDPEHVAWITERCLNVLYYLHHHGVIHGDVKPQNIIVEPEKHTVVMVDYGLSIVKPKRGTPTKGYTPYFAAPEQMAYNAATKEYEPSNTPPIPQTDLYGLGMTMIFALGGDVANVSIDGSKCPREMMNFIKSLIRRNPLKRPDVWENVNLCDTIRDVRMKDFGRVNSGMKPLNV
jgi:serine/threonine protein kinase